MTWPARFAIGISIAIAACAKPPAPVTNHAVVSFAGCRRAADCIAACDKGDAIGCRRASQFVVWGLDYARSGGDDIATMLPYEQKGCRAGDKLACFEAQDRRMNQVEATKAELATFEAEACEHDIAEACRTLVWDVDDETVKLESATKAKTLFAKACDAGDDEGCLGVAQVYGAFVSYNAGSGYPELGFDEAKALVALRRAAAIDERACGEGDPLACISRVWLYDAKPLGQQTTDPHVWVERACKLAGATPSCWTGSKPAVLSPPDNLEEIRLP